MRSIVLKRWPQFLLDRRFVDRDMFMRYFGRGIGHLEQFPPANNGDEDDGDTEAEVDDFVVADTAGDGDGDDEDKDEEVEEVGEDEGTDEDEDLETEEEEWLDEETGNVY